MQKKRGKTFIIGLVLICLLVVLNYWILQVNPLFLRKIGISLRFSFTLVFPALMIIFTAALFLPERWGKWAALFVFAGVFSLPLIGVWASGLTDNYMMSGMLPLADAGAYYANTMWFVQNGVFSVFASRRPLFNGLLVGMAAISQFNLVQIQSILVIIVAVPCALISLRLLNQLHPVSIALFTTVLFFYFRRYAGVVSSETVGFTLGVLGCFFLWDSIREKKFSDYLVGIFLTTLALLARAGAFAILPMLLLWGIFYLRKENTPLIKFILVFCIPILAAYLVNKVLLVSYGASEGVAFSNYSYSLYGLAKGGAYWTQIFEDHPELLDLPNSEQTRMAYQLAVRMIADKPMQFITGLLTEWKLFFSETYYGIWSFISPHPLQAAFKNIPMLVTHISLYGLSLAGMVFYARDRKNAYRSFAAFAFAGFLLSVPLAPPSHAYGLRAFAASLWVLGLLPAVGLDGLIPARWKGAKVEEAFPAWNGLALGAAGVIVLLICIGPAIASLSGERRSVAAGNSVVCSEGEAGILLDYHPQSTVTIDREDAFFLDGRSHYHQGRFMRNLHDIAAIEYVTDFGYFDAPFVIVPTILEDSGESVLLVDQHGSLPKTPGTFLVCGEKTGVLNVYEWAGHEIP